MGGGRDKAGTAIYRRRNGVYERIDGKPINHRFKAVAITDKMEISELPKTLQKFDGHKKVSEDIRNNSLKFAQRFIDEGLSDIQSAIAKFEFRKRVPESVVSQILSSGRIKNFLETHTTMGDDSVEDRIEASKVMFQYDDELEPREFENFGYLGDGNSVAADDYGDLDIVFKKDAMMDKTTITYGDSLLGKLAPSFVSNPGIASLFGYGKYAGGIPNQVTVKQAKQFAQDARKLLRTGKAWQYAELQFHGDLPISNIDHFSVPSFWKDNPSHEATIREIEASGFKITYDDAK